MEATSTLRAGPEVGAEPVDLERAARTMPAIGLFEDEPPGASEAGLWLLHVRFERLRTAVLGAALVAEHTPLASRLARRAHRDGESLEELGQVAQVALIGAIDRFECERSIPFTVTATTAIVGALERHVDRSGPLLGRRRLVCGRDLRPTSGHRGPSPC